MHSPHCRDELHQTRPYQLLWQWHSLPLPAIEESLPQCHRPGVVLVHEEHRSLAQEALVPPHHAWVIESSTTSKPVMAPSSPSTDFPPPLARKPLPHDRLRNFVRDASDRVHSPQTVKVAIGSRCDAERRRRIAERRPLLRDGVPRFALAPLVEAIGATEGWRYSLVPGIVGLHLPRCLEGQLAVVVILLRREGEGTAERDPLRVPVLLVMARGDSTLSRDGRFVTKAGLSCRLMVVSGGLPRSGRGVPKIVGAIYVDGPGGRLWTNLGEYMRRWRFQLTDDRTYRVQVTGDNEIVLSPSST